MTNMLKYVSYSENVSMLIWTDSVSMVWIKSSIN